jgi:hypothetical protein
VSWGVKMVPEEKGGLGARREGSNGRGHGVKLSRWGVLILQ